MDFLVSMCVVWAFQWTRSTSWHVTKRSTSISLWTEPAIYLVPCTETPTPKRCYIAQFNTYFQFSSLCLSLVQLTREMFRQLINRAVYRKASTTTKKSKAHGLPWIVGTFQMSSQLPSLWSPKNHNLFYKSPPLYSNLCQFNPVYTILLLD